VTIAAPEYLGAAFLGGLRITDFNKPVLPPVIQFQPAALNTPPPTSTPSESSEIGRFLQYPKTN